VENTTLLIEDQANQLALAKNEVEALRQIVQYLEAREIALTAQVTNRQNQVENLLVKNFFKDEKISGLAKQNERLGVAVFQQAVRTLGLWAKGANLARRYDALKAEFQYAAKRLFELAVEVGQLAKERDAWMKRALFARRQYDRVVADRAYYRGKLKDAGIKA
jgi:predicted  nucleic acid-binding Zn-ribbon protein